MKNKSSILAIILLLFFFSCNDDSEESSLETENSSTPPVHSEPDNGTKHLYLFSMEEGKCLNKEGEEGENHNQLKECGDLSYQNLEGIDLRDKTLYGLNLKGAIISKSKLSFKNMAAREMKINEDTFFEKVKNPFTKLRDQHLNMYENLERNIVKNHKRTKKIELQIEKDKERYELAKNESKKEKILARMKKRQEQLALVTKNLNISLNKRSRHLDFARMLYPFALNEPAYTNPVIKNKTWLSLNGISQFEEKAASNTYFSDGSFSVSVWVRTSNKQNDKRIVNFHHGQSPESALNIMVKGNHLLAGYRDENIDYHEIKHTIDYSDEKWHHVVVTYDESVFKFYVNGELVNEKEDSFSGFGAYPMIVGSYDGKTRFFSGDIDELSLWDISLSPEGVEAIYNEGAFTNLKRHRDADKLINWFRW